MSVYYNIWRGLSIFITIILALAFSGFSGMHLSMHLYQMSMNMTSIEYADFIRRRATGSHLGLQAPQTHKYDFGTFEVCNMYKLYITLSICMGDYLVLSQ